MTKLLLSKSTLTQQKNNLASYKKFVPALDLKRQQLRLAIKELERKIDEINRDYDQAVNWLRDNIPMVSVYSIADDLSLRVIDVEYRPWVVAGSKLKMIDSVRYSQPTSPINAEFFWYFRYLQQLENILRLQLELNILKENISILTAALKKVTQRVNLFEKILIPEAVENIRKIQIYLGDRAREAVVTSKIAKSRHK